MSRRLTVCALCVLTAALLLVGGCSLAAIGAGALLHPLRRTETPPPPAACTPRTFPGVGVTLRGWYCAAEGDRRGALVYLHGVADNRASGAGVVQRYVSRGFDVIAYDSRAHGQSSGDSCTYGYYEKQDLTRIIETLPPGPIVLLGTSLGAAVAASVVFTGRREDIAAATADLDVAVLPSLREAQGISILEAMARRRPVIATAVGGIPEVITSGVDGLLVPPADPVALASALGSVLTDAALRERIAEAGYRTVVDRYSIDAQVKRIEAVYDEELARAGVPFARAARAPRPSVRSPRAGRGALEVPPV